jgi:hypothetical protein
MTDRSPDRARWATVAVFAIAMAWVEAASVYYIRTTVGRIEPYQPDPLPFHSVLGPVELVREASTLVMLFTLGVLAGRTWPSRLGYSALAFGVWDILYYVFLRWMTGWPSSVLDWDILFLLPLPWWGPVLAPVSIAVLMIVWGTLVTQFPGDRSPLHGTGMTSVCGAGIALALYVFMADALHVLPQGADVIRQVLPTWFNWPMFLVALALMSAPLVEMAWQFTARPRQP